jgi:hypothetical protein
LSVPGVASPGAAGYDFLGKQLRIGWRGGRMDWARILAFVTGMVDQELLARIEYLTKYAAYYNELRTHRSLNKDAPIHRAIQHVGRIVSAPVLGGLHHHYSRI